MQVKPCQWIPVPKIPTIIVHYSNTRNSCNRMVYLYMHASQYHPAYTIRACIGLYYLDRYGISYLVSPPIVYWLLLEFAIANNCYCLDSMFLSLSLSLSLPVCLCLSVSRSLSTVSTNFAFFCSIFIRARKKLNRGRKRRRNLFVQITDFLSDKIYFRKKWKLSAT